MRALCAQMFVRRQVAARGALAATLILVAEIMLPPQTYRPLRGHKFGGNIIVWRRLFNLPRG